MKLVIKELLQCDLMCQMQTDPEGTYAGAIFRIDGAGRDLTGYDALLFGLKASQGVTIGEFGFGEDFGENKYLTTLPNVSVGTAWTKVYYSNSRCFKIITRKRYV